MAQLALGQNLVIRWRHLHCSQSWPPGRVTCIATLPVSIELVSARITSVKSAKPLGFTHSVRETRTHRSNQGYLKKWKWCLNCEEKSSYWYVRDGMEVVEVEKVRGMFLFLFFNSGNILHKSSQHNKISTKVFPTNKAHLCVISGGIPGPSRAVGWWRWQRDNVHILWGWNQKGIWYWKTCMHRNLEEENNLPTSFPNESPHTQYPPKFPSFSNFILPFPHSHLYSCEIWNLVASLIDRYPFSYPTNTVLHASVPASHC